MKATVKIYINGFGEVYNTTNFGNDVIIEQDE